MPQSPQLFTSFERLAQPPIGQAARPAPHPDVHLPLLHTAPAPQLFPHVPQLSRLVWRSSQAPASTPPGQTVSLSGQPHAPLVHAAPAGHAMPQAPQFDVSLIASTQVVIPSEVHGTRPVAHPAWHAPSRQWFPGPQLTLHEPQYMGLDVMSMHLPLQGVRPAAHTQAPAVQVAPAVQTSPQVPQFDGSFAGFTHPPAQSVWPAPQVAAQAPLAHTAAAPHLVSQPPQLAGSLCVSVHTPRQSFPPL
jgi:hypothetical protein